MSGECDDCEEHAVDCVCICTYKGGWISAKTQPPSREFPILVWAEHLDTPVAVHWLENGTYGEPGFFYTCDEYNVLERDITHWMPAPKPPQHN
jgi:hypothetical protein